MGDQIRSVRVRLSAENASYIASMRSSGAVTKQTAREMDGLSTSARRADSDLDRVSGRAKILAQALAVLGPATIPVTATAIPALSGLASQLGFTAAGAGTMVLAFQGVGDTLKAVNKARLEPTTDNLIAAQVAMDRLSPSARRLVQELQSLAPKGRRLTADAADGLFPGLISGINSLEQVYPRARKIVQAISGELGDIAAESGQSLASDRWAPFLDFVGTEAPRNLDVMAESLGSVVHGLAGLWMGTQPLNNDFNDWLLSSTSRFDRWANTLDSNRAYQDLLDYIDDNGPQAGETLGAIADSLVQIVQAAAPLGGPVLQGLESTAKVIGAIADSDLGTPIFTAIAALSLYNRGLRVTASLQKSALGQRLMPAISGRPAGGGFGIQIPSMREFGTVAYRAGQSSKYASSQTLMARESVRSFASTAGRAAAPVAGIALVTSGLADKMGLSNSASLAMAGALAGPWGAAIGAGIGGVLDLVDANKKLDDTLESVVKTASSGDLEGMTRDIAALNKELEDSQNRDGFWDGLSDSAKQMGDRFIHPFRDVDWKEKQIAGQVAWAKSIYATGRAIDVSAAKQRLGFKGTAAGIKSATQSAKDFEKALTKAQRVLSGRGAAADYAAAIDDMTQSIKDNGKTLDINTEKGRNNRTALDAIATSAHQMSTSILDPALKTKFMDNARAEYIKAAKAAGVGGAAARKMADDVGLLNLITGRPKIDLNSNEFFVGVDEVWNAIFGLRGQSVTIPVKFTGSTNATVADFSVNAPKPPKKKPRKKKALGGPIDGPGTKTSDDVPIWASAGEFMQPASAVDYYGEDFMEAIRRRQIPRYAGGGVVGSSGSKLGAYIRGDLDMKFPETLKQWELALRRSEKAIDKERSKRDDLVSKRSDFQNTIIDGLRHDPFGTDRPEGWEWMAGADRKRFLTNDPNRILDSNAANGNAYKAALQALSGKGLDGKAFEMLAGTGDLERVQAFAGLSKAQLAAYETRVQKSNSATYGAGKFGAGVVYNAQIDKTNDHLAVMVSGQKGIQRELKDIKAEIRHHGAAGKASKGAAGAKVRTRKKAT